MGWGISFDLQDDKIVCTSGCRWSAVIKNVPPSGYRRVLQYYEYDAHRELDMIRDECPGTASALRAACADHLSRAVWSYEHESMEKKKKWHDEFMETSQTVQKKLLKREVQYFPDKT